MISLLKLETRQSKKNPKFCRLGYPMKLPELGRSCKNVIGWNYHPGCNRHHQDYEPFLVGNPELVIDTSNQMDRNGDVQRFPIYRFGSSSH